MSRLQQFLLGNALFSFFSGLVLLVWPMALSQIFAVPDSTPFWVTGLILVLFATWVALVAWWQNYSAVRSIILQDMIWVLASTAILLVKPWNISETGHQVIAAVMLAVLFFGIGQYSALAQESKSSGPKMKQFSVQRVLPFGKSQVWSVVSDVANYHRVAPNIDDVEIISGKGKGMIRSCSHGDDSWTETCLNWEEEAEYVFEVDTEAPDYPYPFKYLRGTWKLVEVDDHHTEVQMIFDIQMKTAFHSIMFPLMRGRFRKICLEIFDNWHEQLETYQGKEEALK